MILSLTVKQKFASLIAVSIPESETALSYLIECGHSGPWERHAVHGDGLPHGVGGGGGQWLGFHHPPHDG